MKPERASSTYFGGRGRGGQSEPTPTNAPFFWFLINEFFRCYFFLNPDLHITFSPGYPTDLVTLQTTSWPCLSTNNRPPYLPTYLSISRLKIMDANIAWLVKKPMKNLKDCCGYYDVKTLWNAI